jgi:uncharacterized protein (TIGR00266 family)
MAHKLDYKIIGSDLQAVEIVLDPNESVRAEPGTFLSKMQGIEMQTNAEGGVFGGLKRMFSGESFFITNFLNTSSERKIIRFAASYPGHILPMDLASLPAQTLYCQRESFLCAAGGIDVTVAFTKRLGAGLFGGEGFILQKLVGDGLAFVHIGGTLIEQELAAGEVLEVDTGCIAAFTEGIDYDIKFVGGFKNALFGGEGLFFATLTGPGKVYLQSLPFSRLADRIVSIAVARMPKGEGGLGSIGSILGS